MYYIGLDVHKKAISYYVKDASGLHLQRRKSGRDPLGTRQLDQDSSTALDSSDGSYDLHRLDL